MSFIRYITCSVAAISLIGCAHPINVAPDQSKITRELGGPARIKARAGYFIPAEALMREVTTPGGGGDNVRYYPYKDLEAGYQRMLSNVFDDVVKLDSISDNYDTSRSGVKYILTPEVITTSGSTGFFTWPPTTFTVDLKSKVRDSSGKIVGNPHAIGTGQVSGVFDLKGDFGLAGRIAMENALKKMQNSLLDLKYEDTTVSLQPLQATPIAVSTSTSSAPQSKDQISSRLEKVRELFDRGLISKLDYERKRKEILDSL